MPKLPPDARTRLNKRRRAFTLIELLVVIAIIGALSAILLPVLGRSKRNALSTACRGNLHQIGLAMDMYVQDNNFHLPVCAPLPSLNPALPSIATVLLPHAKSAAVFRCPADRTVFPVEQTSYEWNSFLNGASYDRPEEWSPATRAIVEIVFGGRLNTPLIGDAASFHPRGPLGLGKNSVYFDGRVDY